MDMSKLLDDLKKINPSILKDYFSLSESNGWEGWSDGQKVIINRLIYDIRLFDGTKPFDIEDVEADVIKQYLIETINIGFYGWSPNQIDLITEVIEDIVMYATHAE
jgi:hypothetical protein